MPSALVVGDWHLAAVTAAGVARLGYQVYRWPGEDHGQVCHPADEPGVEEAFAGADLRVLGSPAEAVEAAASCDVSVVAFDSRTSADGSTVDTRPSDAAELLLRAGAGAAPVVLMSQVRAGTSDAVLRAAGLSADSGALVHLPENLRLGKALADFLRPARTIIGCNATEPPVAVDDLVGRLASGSVLRMSLVESELVKHATNAYLAGCVTLANDVGTIAARLGADPDVVMRGVQADSRVADSAPLRPGGAYAGATLQRDVRALSEAGGPIGRDGLFNAISRSNAVHALRPLAVLDRLLEGFAGRTVCFIGLTYKPDVPTLRDSPVTRLAGELAAGGCRVTAYDPVAESAPSGPIVRCGTLAEAAEGADCLVLATEHTIFGAPGALDLAVTKPRTRLLLRMTTREQDSLVSTPDRWQAIEPWEG